jgi:hypothetical protein
MRQPEDDWDAVEGGEYTDETGIRNEFERKVEDESAECAKGMAK